MTFKVITLGCKLNSCESAAIEKSFLEDGYTKTDEAKAHVYVINSCAVTGTAVAKARHTLSKCRRDNPGGVVVLCGCYPQSYPEEAGLKFGADIVAGNADKSKLPELVREFMRTRHKAVKIKPLSREYDLSSAIPDEDRTRAFLKIEDGCDRFCSYCISPRARALAADKDHRAAGSAVRQYRTSGDRPHRDKSRVLRRGYRAYAG